MSTISQLSMGLLCDKFKASVMQAIDADIHLEFKDEYNFMVMCLENFIADEEEERMEPE